MQEPVIQPPLQWTPSGSLKATLPCALGVGISFYSLSKKSSHPRFTLFSIAIPIIVAFRSSNEFSADDFVNEIFARFLLIFLAHQSFLHWILAPEEVDIERRRFSDLTSKYQKVQKEDVPQLHSWQGAPRNWTFAYKMLFNARCLGTKWQVRHANPSGEATIKSEPSPRVKFILKRLGVLLLRYIFLCFYYDPSFHLYMPDGVPWKQEDFSPSNQQLFWRFLFSFPDLEAQARHFLTRGAFIRLYIVGDQLIPDYSILSSYHEILSIIAVGLHIDSPEEWPPLFGQIGQAYSVRRYWSHFWHLLVYRSFSAHAEYMTTKVTGTRKRTTIMRYANNALVFVLSGLMHAVVERTLNPGSCSRCGCWATFWRYSLQIVAMVAEELFQNVTQELEHRLIPAQTRYKCVTTIHRVSGYTWVIFWTLWSKEFTFFPQAYCLKH
ncbi:membrane bound O-acyl transferase family-domain-containing protein [Fusarium avenaceum]|nr:membrane bound O-acyl transferase family-domain-containing protein [Fusarium avenaceum]